MTESLPSDKNKHIRDYLSYYISLSHAPHYAVMITGPWGIGKTFLIKKLLAERFKDGKEYIYLSLYGLSSRDDLDVALFQAAYPLLGSKTVKVGARLSMAALKTLSKFYHVELPDFKVSDLASRPTAVLYVFDDLERCAMPINTVLGYINEFVEHDDQKVVIVANEQGLESEEYKTRKEKLIGKTLEM
jgi:Cdc6-like AAA superfamily ATPase